MAYLVIHAGRLIVHKVVIGHRGCLPLAVIPEAISLNGRVQLVLVVWQIAQFVTKLVVALRIPGTLVEDPLMNALV